jgi:Eco57I restriction-modification methylase
VAIDVSRARQYLKDFAFKALFVEELGWERHAASHDVTVDSESYRLAAFAHKRGLAVFVCEPGPDGRIPEYATRRKIDRQVTKLVHEHVIVFVDSCKTTQVWEWVKREPGKPVACREHTYHTSQPGDALIQKLQALNVSIDEEVTLTLPEVTGLVRAAFDVERVTKRFYDRFKSEHEAFLEFLNGIPDEDLERWYVSVMLNRLMFIYFIQKKGFLGNNPNYLRDKLGESKNRGKDRFYSDFLSTLFFEGFAKKGSDRSAATNAMLGSVPYLNGGLFLKHQIEECYGKAIQIGDVAFEKLFAFFEQYNWHLDERPLKRDDEINPDVLGYIFEKYINQKQMGAYYTKEDITGYISQSTVLPFLFEKARKNCSIAFEGEHSIWRLLQTDPDRYIYKPLKKGVGVSLPPNIAAGVKDISKRAEWNKPADGEHALPTEIWREVANRRCRCEEIRSKLVKGDVRSIDDLITLNLDIRQFAQDVIETSEGPELLRAFYEAIRSVSVLDPACGSGAFLFATLNILESLYEACLDRMQVFLDELELSKEKHRPDKFIDFKQELEKIAAHPNRKYFIYKAIIINNLFGVDIMEEATEICKLRLFLKLVAQIERPDQIEPLPDIDFNIRAGNSLVGYASYDDVKRAVTSKLDFENTMDRIAEKAKEIDSLFQLFREMQSDQRMESKDFAKAKEELQRKLKSLEDELSRYLAGEYGIKPNNRAAYEEWLSTHKPFHWFIEFYRVLAEGGFDAVIGNPPYVVFPSEKVTYSFRPHDYQTADSKNLYALFFERSFQLASNSSPVGLIVQLTSLSSERVACLQNLLSGRGRTTALSFPRRPESIFDAVEMPVAIIISFPGISSYVTSRVNRFYTEERPHAIEAVELTTHELRRDGHRIAKLGSSLQVAIFQKLGSHSTLLGTLTCRDSRWQLYYQEACRYWVKAVIGIPFFKRNGQRMDPPHGRIVPFSTELACDFTGCLMNSSLFYWAYSVLCDCEHINDAFLQSFPIPSNWATTDWKKLGTSLSADMKANATRKVITTKQGHRIEYDEMKALRSKSRIDAIDCCLAKLYGFTEQERDFLVNYDIKYRMGDELEEADD